MLPNREDYVFVHFSTIQIDGFDKFDQGGEVEFEIEENPDSEKLTEAISVSIISKDRDFKIFFNKFTK